MQYCSSLQSLGKSSFLLKSLTLGHSFVVIADNGY